MIEESDDVNGAEIQEPTEKLEDALDALSSAVKEKLTVDIGTSQESIRSKEDVENTVDSTTVQKDIDIT